MKSRDRFKLQNLPTLLQYLAKGGIHDNMDIFFILLEYLARMNEVEEKEVVAIIRKELGSKAEELMPSLAKKWFEQGKEKGIEKGREKGRKEGAFLKAVETCRNLLKEGLSFETISRVTDLSVEKILEIQKETK